MKKRTGYGKVRIAVAKIHKTTTSPGRTADEELEAKLGFELFTEGEPRLGWILTMSYVSDKMDLAELVKIYEILNPNNKLGRLTIIVCMGAEKLRLNLPHLIRAVRQACLIVTWVSDPMDGNTIKAPSGLKTRLFDAIWAELLAVFDVHEEDKAEYVNSLI